MKKAYIKPASEAVVLYAEAALLSGSLGGDSITIVSGEETDEALSGGRDGWNSVDWSDGSED